MSVGTFAPLGLIVRFGVLLLYVLALVPGGYGDEDGEDHDDGDKNEHVDINSRSSWGVGELPDGIAKLQLPVCRVTIHQTGDNICRRRDDCKSRLIELKQSFEGKNWMDIGFSFLIGDGEIFEGRGWEYDAGYDKQLKSISIAFIGNFASDAPPRKSLRAAKCLIREGVKKDYIQENYTLTTFRDIQDESVPGYALLNKIKEWKHFHRECPLTGRRNCRTDDLSKYDCLAAGCCYNSAGLNGPSCFKIVDPPGPNDEHNDIVNRSEWHGGELDEVELNKTLQLPVCKVTIHQTGGDDCSSSSSCEMRLKQILEDFRKTRATNIGYNFLIGGERIYEGMGWNHKAGYASQSKSISIAFIGNFSSEAPALANRIAARHLIRQGVKKNFIQGNYTLTTLRDKQDKSLPGDALLNKIQEWRNFHRECPGNERRACMPECTSKVGCLAIGCCYDSSKPKEPSCFKTVPAGHGNGSESDCLTGNDKPEGTNKRNWNTGKNLRGNGNKDCHQKGKRNTGCHKQGTSRGKSKEKYNVMWARRINNYSGPVVDILHYTEVAKLLPIGNLTNLTISDVDEASPQLFAELPEAKILALTRQTLKKLSAQNQTAVIEDNFASKGCGFVQSISVDKLGEAGRVSLSLALNMCNCSEQDFDDTPAKIMKLCEVIDNAIQTFEEFRDLATDMCPICFTDLLHKHTDWRDRMTGDLLTKACNKVGGSFVLAPTHLAHWARICPQPTNADVQAKGCLAFRPSLLAYRPSLPSPTELFHCKELFCSRLCSLTANEIQVITRALKNNKGDEDVGCLVYLDDITHTKGWKLAAVNATTIGGSCQLRSKVIKRTQQLMHSRKKRSCSVTCDDIKSDVAADIDPPDVLDPSRIETCLGGRDFSVCLNETELGDYRWDRQQAVALYNVLLRDKTFESIKQDLGILGFIGLAFSPAELNSMHNYTDEVYSVFGAVYGWSPMQLRTLAYRYLDDHRLQASDLTNIHLTRLNHLMCGLTAQDAKNIRGRALNGAKPVLGMMQRCEVEVLKVFAQYFVRHDGEVDTWYEEELSESGILLAGLPGDKLNSVGPKLMDHMTVAVVNHIPPPEFRKLEPEQTKQFKYEVALAISKRGLCAWLHNGERTGYLEYLCTDSSANAPATSLLSIILLAITAIAISTTIG